MDIRKPRIAVVDDEKLLILVLSSIMRQYNYEADFYSSPVKALDTITQDAGRYQLVISDIRMPEMDGITFARKVRALAPSVPIVFMTGAVSPQLRQEVNGLGNVVVLEKPFPLETTLREVIQQFVGSDGQPPAAG